VNKEGDESSFGYDMIRERIFSVYVGKEGDSLTTRFQKELMYNSQRTDRISV
jgi:hypothetical protein